MLYTHLLLGGCENGGPSEGGDCVVYPPVVGQHVYTHLLLSGCENGGGASERGDHFCGGGVKTL